MLDLMRPHYWSPVVCSLTCLWCFVAPVLADSKVFTGSGDGVTWHDVANWSAQGVPGAGDVVTVDKANAAITANQTVAVGSLTVGGKASSALTMDIFADGEIVPASVNDVALHIRKDGAVVLKGTGSRVILRGSFKNSEESMPSEPSVLILLQ